MTCLNYLMHGGETTDISASYVSYIMSKESFLYCQTLVYRDISGHQTPYITTALIPCVFKIQSHHASHSIFQQRSP